MFFKEQLNVINEIEKLYAQAANSRRKHNPEKNTSELEKRASELEAALLSDIDSEAKPLLEQILYAIKSVYHFPAGENPDLIFENYQQFENYRALFQPDEESFKSRYQYLLSLCKLAYLEEKNGIPEEHAFKLALMFDSEREASKYLIDFMNQHCNLTKEEQKGKNKEEIASLKHQKERHEFNVHNACLFGLPTPSCDWKAWRKFAKSELINKDFRGLLSIAEDIETLIEENTAQKVGYKKEQKEEIIHQIKEHEQTLKKLEKLKNKENAEQISQLKKELHALRQEKYDLTKEYDPILISYKADALAELNQKYKDKSGKQNTQRMSPEEKIKAKEELRQLAAQLSEKRTELFLLSAGLSFDKYSITQLICCADFRKKQSADNYLLTHGLAKNSVEKFNTLNRTEAGKEIPDLKIDGAQYSYPGIYLMKVDTSDLLQASRAACIGKLTGCCQSIGDVGEPCAIHGLTSPYGGFYVVCQGDINAPTVEDELLGACWVWRSNNAAICFDSIETNEKQNNAVITLFNKLSIKLVMEGHTHRVNCGAASGISYKLGMIPSLFIPEYPEDYKGYRDSHQQRLVYDKTLSFLFYDQYDFAKKDTQQFIEACLSNDIPLNKNIPFCIMLNQLLINNKQNILNFTKEKARQHKNIAEVELILDKIIQFSNNEISSSDILNNPENHFLLAAIKGDRETLLQQFVKNQQIDDLERLLTHKDIVAYSINSLNLKGLSALHHAIDNNNLDILNLLLAHGADPNLKDNQSNTPLMLAIKNKNIALALFLMDWPNVNVDMDDNDGNHPIMKAIELGLTDVTLQLIEKGAIIDEVNEMGQTALQFAIKANNLVVINKIIENVSQEHINHKNTLGETAITLALNYANVENFEIFMNKTLISLNHVISDGFYENCSLLTLAIAYGRTNIAKTHIEKMPLDSLNHPISEGFFKGDTLLTLAVRYGNVDIFNHLVEKMPPDSLNHVISEGDRKGYTPLTLAITCGRTDIAKALIEKMPPDSLNHLISEGVDKSYTPLTLAITCDRAGIAKALIEKMPLDSLNHVISEGRYKGYTPLTLGITHGRTGIAKALIEKMPPDSLNHLISEGGYKGYTFLTFAITCDRAGIAKALIEKMPLDSLNHPIYEGVFKGDTLLTLAVRYGNVDIFNHLVEKMPPDSLNHVISEGRYKGNTPLTLASTHGRTDIAKTLIEKMPPDSLNHLISEGVDKGNTPLTLAITYGCTNIAKALIEKMPPESLNHVISEGRYKGHTPLTLANLLHHTDIAKALIEKMSLDSLSNPKPHTKNERILVFIDTECNTIKRYIEKIKQTPALAKKLNSLLTRSIEIVLNYALNGSLKDRLDPPEPDWFSVPENRKLVQSWIANGYFNPQASENLGAQFLQRMALYEKPNTPVQPSSSRSAPPPMQPPSHEPSQPSSFARERKIKSGKIELYSKEGSRKPPIAASLKSHQDSQEQLSLDKITHKRKAKKLEDKSSTSQKKLK